MSEIENILLGRMNSRSDENNVGRAHSLAQRGEKNTWDVEISRVCTESYSTTIIFPYVDSLPVRYGGKFYRSWLDYSMQHSSTVSSSLRVWEVFVRSSRAACASINQLDAPII